MYDELENDLIKIVDRKVRAHGFEQIDVASPSAKFSILAAWKLRSKINTGIAMVRPAKHITNIGAFVRSHKKSIGQAIGYFPTHDPIGLHLIVVGGKFDDSVQLNKYLDTFNTGNVNLQTLHVIDFDKMNAISVQNWGLKHLIQFPEAIERAITFFLAKQTATEPYTKNNPANLKERYVKVKADPRKLWLLLGLLITIGLLSIACFILGFIILPNI